MYTRCGNVFKFSMAISMATILIINNCFVLKGVFAWLQTLQFVKISYIKMDDKLQPMNIS